MNWIPTRDQLPENEDWVVVQTQDGTVYPASYKKNQWVPLFRGGLVEQLMHGKVAYWMPHEPGFAYVQCKCGNFYLQAEGRKTCPICASMGISVPDVEDKPKRTRKAKEAPIPDEDIPFAETGFMEEDLALLQQEEDEQ